MFKELPEGQTYSCTHTIDGSICGKCLGVKGFVEQRHSEKPDGMKPTLIETFKNCTMIALILLFCVVFPVAAIISTAYFFTHQSNQSTFISSEAHIAFPKHSFQNCSVGQATSKEEAQKIADSTGCPAYY